MFPSLNWGGPHRLFVLGRDAGHGQIPINCQVLLLGMVAERWQLGADEALLGEKCVAVLIAAKR